MGREMIDDQTVEKVVGGSIVFNTAHTTCGYNKNNEYKVNNYDKAKDYLVANYGKMSERDLLKKLVSKGYISPM